MLAFRDREKATAAINTLLVEKTIPWIVLSGNSRIGKTEFARTIAKENEFTVLCEPACADSYAYMLVKAVQPNRAVLKEAICSFAIDNPCAQNIFDLFGVQYIHTLKEEQVDKVLNKLIVEDPSSTHYLFAQFLAQTILKDVQCIILDNFHWCDFESYKWILEFCKPSSHITVIAICNFSLPWESKKLLIQFQTITSPISLDQFDSENAYFDILKDNYVCENDIALRDTARKLFVLFNGDSQLLFETIRLSKGNAYLKKDGVIAPNSILELAKKVHLKQFDELTPTHWFILRLLACSPVPITKNCILSMAEIHDALGSIIIMKLYDGNFITQDVDDTTGQTLYFVRDEFIREIAMDGISERERKLCETKILRAIQKGFIDANLEQTLDLSLSTKDPSDFDLLQQVMHLHDDVVSTEKKAMYLNRFLINRSQIPTALISFDTAKLLYDFGFYNSAIQILSEEGRDNEQPCYEYLMLLGDIQHLLLYPKTSETYERAASVQGISTSQKLMAINRQIMALNQEHQEDTAMHLYRQVLCEYANTECLGMVELYRNTNNSFGYAEAINYTAKGYHLAKKLGEELEAYKCLHNICMIQLQYGHYGKSFINNPLSFEPTFEYVLEFFANKPEYRHEQAYPLLDLGTAEMFKYATQGGSECLIRAKQMYSEAQLYAKSFYAQHIAETGLLVVNSYLYANQDLLYVTELRKMQFARYQSEKDNIADYRVHRKVLLSLALSAIIGDNLGEATEYLKYVYPYIYGPETLRYNKLCVRAGCTIYQKEPVSIEGKYRVYYESDRFVPWLISLCH